jgi:3-oxoacyl-[acyl-carrier protein] reductase
MTTSPLAADASTRLTGQRALVVGGGGHGIGRAICRAAAAAGASLAVADISAPAARDVVAEIVDRGGEAIAVTGDVTDRAVAGGLVREADSALGGITTLITVLGGQGPFHIPFSRLHELTDREIDLAMTVNLGYVYDVLRASLAVMLERGEGGAIVSVGSISGGHTGAPRQSAYGAAKAGLSSLARTVAVEYGPDGIRMNVVSPGSISTPSADARPGIETIAASIPLQRRGTPEDIASAVVFLASSAASYVSGQTLCVDGGVGCAFPIPRAQAPRPT